MQDLNFFRGLVIGLKDFIRGTLTLLLLYSHFIIVLAMTIIKWQTICFGMLQQFSVRAGKYKENPPCKDMRRVGSTFFQISLEQIIYQAFKDITRDTRREHVKILKS